CPSAPASPVRVCTNRSAMARCCASRRWSACGAAGLPAAASSIRPVTGLYTSAIVLPPVCVHCHSNVLRTAELHHSYAFLNRRLKPIPVAGGAGHQQLDTFTIDLEVRILV